MLVRVGIMLFELMMGILVLGVLLCLCMSVVWMSSFGLLVILRRLVEVFGMILLRM